jgi:predicted 2-oxoglutarate/Fe(II)-dependent dioxygenase YbiX
LNLNDDYDGGELRFPEYGTDRYRPAAGEALVFSGAHLHEVLPVSRGQRFVLLSFLFGDRPQPA